MTLVLADGPVVLVSWWKPIVLLLPFLGWAYIVSTIYDKHAAEFFLPRGRWNIAHMIVALVAIGIALALPVPGVGGFFAALGVIVLLLGADLYAYMVVANKDDRVPEHRHVRIAMPDRSAAKASKAAAKASAEVQLVINRPDKSLVAPPEKGTPEFDVRIDAETLYIRASEARASRVELGPVSAEQGYRIGLLVDGVQQPGDAVPPAAAVRIIDFWKNAAGLDVEDRRRRLVGEATVTQGEVKSTARIVTSGTKGGMRLTMALDPAKHVLKTFDQLGLMPQQIEELRSVANEDKGVVLVAGPPLGGRTTSLYAIVRMHDAYMSNIQTVEMDPQASLEGVRQNKFDPYQEGGPEYATLVRSILRRDPSVLAIAELPDQATAQVIARADHDRTRCYISMRADNALIAIQNWVKAVGDPALAAKSLHGVVAQALVRKVCGNCRVAYAPSPDMLRKLGLPPDRIKQLYKKGGQVLIKNKPEVCPVCSGVGYFGQTGVFEVYSLGPAERKIIESGNLNALRLELRKRPLQTIQQSAILKAVDGTTTIEEVMRVSAKPEASEKKPAAAVT